MGKASCFGGNAISEDCGGMEVSDCVLKWPLLCVGSFFESAFGGYEITLDFIAEVCRLRFEMPEDLRSLRIVRSDGTSNSFNGEVDLCLLCVGWNEFVCGECRCCAGAGDVRVGDHVGLAGESGVPFA